MNAIPGPCHFDVGEPAAGRMYRGSEILQLEGQGEDRLLAEIPRIACTCSARSGWRSRRYCKCRRRQATWRASSCMQRRKISLLDLSLGKGTLPGGRASRTTFAEEYCIRALAVV